MPRNLSDAALSSLLAQETSEAYLVLLTITDNNAVPHRFTSDSVDTYVDPGGANIRYESFPFDIALPQNVENQVSTSTLTITNVDRRLIDEIRGQRLPMNVNIQVVLSSAPDDVLAEFIDFKWRHINYDASTISGTLTLEDFMSEPVGILMTARDFPGLFFTT
jgi:hypothetical protein